jgi:hypothetical protein
MTRVEFEPTILVPSVHALGREATVISNKLYIVYNLKLSRQAVYNEFF